MAVWPPQLAEQLRAVAPERLAGLQLRCEPSIDSSNSELLRQAQQGNIQPQLLWALAQTAGRGRLGRDWHTGSGAAPASSAEQDWRSLSFSLGLVLAPQDWSGLSLVVGLAVAQTLGSAIGLKWPNDICLAKGQGRYAKLGGILLETAPLPAAPHHLAEGARWLVIGLGLNLRGSPPAENLRHPATDLLTALGAEAAAPHLADGGQLLGQLALAILQAVLRFEQTGFAPFAPAFQERDVLQGANIYSHSAHSQGAVGLALGVAADGSYQIQHADGQIEAIYSAELSLKPV